MDPSIMKLLEEDEDENMHSGADVEAFQAALNRDIGGDVSTSKPSEPNSVLSQGNNQTSSQSFLQWQGESTGYQNQQNLEAVQQQGQLSSEMDLKQQGSDTGSHQQQNNASQEFNHLQSQHHQQNNAPQELNHLQPQHQQSNDVRLQGHAEQSAPHIPQTTGTQVSETNSVPVHEQDRMHNTDSQYLKLQKMSNQQATITEQTNIMASRSKQVPFALLMPVIMPQLDKDRAMQLQTLYGKLRKNEIPKEGFVRLMRGIVGDQMLKMAVTTLHGQGAPNQFQLQSQASVPQHHLRMPAAGGSSTQFPDRPTLKGQADLSSVSSSTGQAQSESTHTAVENTAKKSQEVERHLGSHGMQVSQMSSTNSSAGKQEGERSSIPIQGLNKQQQQHVHFPQTSFHMYGNPGGNYQQYTGANVNTSTSSIKTQSHDSQMRQIPLHQSMGGTQFGGVSQSMNMMSVPKFERQNSFNDPKRGQGGPLSQFTSSSAMQQSPAPWQLSTSKEQNPGSSMSANYVKQEPVDQGNEQQQKTQVATPQGLSSISAAQDQANATSGTMKDESLEKQSPRMGFSTSASTVPPNSVSPLPSQMDSNTSLSSRIPSTTSQVGINARTLTKKASVGQKKPLESHGSSPPLPSKKQKVTGTFLDQSIEQLNDVTAVSGVNLREEEEQLFSGPKEDSRVSEASRKVVQEEEERLLLQKIPLQKKLAEIMAKCGVKNISNDVERCLSLCVEERMRGIINSLIRLSKQRVDAEKPRHRTIITSDVRQQIATMNQKAKEEWEKKQAEAEKLRKQNEPEGSSEADGDKDDGRMKSLKVNKEEDDKMRTTAANVAARAAVGGDDMLSKWQLMAEQARQKREGGSDTASGSQPGKDMNRRSSSTSGRNTRENQDADKRGFSSPTGASGTGRKMGRNQAAMAQRVARTICVKDVIAVLEREPQMSRSTLIYRLYEKVRSEAAAE